MTVPRPSSNSIPGLPATVHGLEARLTTLTPPASDPVAPPQPPAVRTRSSRVHAWSIPGSGVGSGVGDGVGVAAIHGMTPSGGDAWGVTLAVVEGDGRMVGRAADGPIASATTTRPMSTAMTA